VARRNKPFSEISMEKIIEKIWIKSAPKMDRCNSNSNEIKKKALELIDLEQDFMCKKKYATIWKKAQDYKKEKP
jgi:hypothetical protein